MRLLLLLHGQNDGMITKRREKKRHCQSFYSKIRPALKGKRSYIVLLKHQL